MYKVFIANHRSEGHGIAKLVINIQKSYKAIGSALWCYQRGLVFFPLFVGPGRLFQYFVTPV